MRAIWRQVPRPRLSSRRAPRQSITSITIRPDFNDLFSVFLAPVFAAATFANLSWKERQKKDWETKFAEIDQELELARRREQEIWARIQLQSLRRGVPSQRRGYATAATSLSIQSQNDVDAHANEPPSDLYAELNPNPPEQDRSATPDEGETAKEKPADPDPDHDPSQAEDPALQRFERLLAYRLALQMLLQVHIGGNPKYGDIYQPSFFQNPELPWDLNQMALRLREVTSELASMKSTVAEKPRSKPSSQSRSNMFNHLNSQLYRLGTQYKTGKINLETLVERFATVIMVTPTTPNIRTYTSLIHLFNYIEQEDLSYLVLAALNDSTLYLDKVAVHTILWRYGKSRDFKRFDAFLRDLTKSNARVQDPWERRRVGDTLVLVPSSFSSLICARLISVALCCAQPDRAEAWAAVMMEERPHHIRLLIVIKHFLQHYTLPSNWEKGRFWVARALEFARNWDHIVLGGHSDPDRQMQVTIFRMLEMCASCGKRQVYDTIFQAAVEAGIEPPELAAARPQFVGLHLQIVEDWKQAYHKLRQPGDDSPMRKRITTFSEKLGALAEELGSIDAESSVNQLPVRFASSKLLTSAASPPAQNEIIEKQKALIKSLQDQVALSNRTLEEERRRLGQIRPQAVQTSPLHQEPLETLQQEPRKTTHNHTELDDRSHKLEAIISQQGATIQLMQTQIAQLVDMASRPASRVTLGHPIQKHLDNDSGYGSDSASDTDSQPSRWSESATESGPESNLRVQGSNDFRVSFHHDKAPRVSLSRLPKSQQLLLTSLSQWLKYYAIATSRAGKLRDLPWSKILSLDHADLIEMGIDSAAVRYLMLKDLKGVRELQLGPEGLKMAKRVLSELKKDKARRRTARDDSHTSHASISSEDPASPTKTNGWTFPSVQEPISEDDDATKSELAVNRPFRKTQFSKWYRFEQKNTQEHDYEREQEADHYANAVDADDKDNFSTDDDDHNVSLSSPATSDGWHISQLHEPTPEFADSWPNGDVSLSPVKMTSRIKSFRPEPKEAKTQAEGGEDETKREIKGWKAR